jgi:hypothetical protein
MSGTHDPFCNGPTHSALRSSISISRTASKLPQSSTHSSTTGCARRTPARTRRPERSARPAAASTIRSSLDAASSVVSRPRRLDRGACSAPPEATPGVGGGGARAVARSARVACTNSVGKEAEEDGGAAEDDDDDDDDDDGDGDEEEKVLMKSSAKDMASTRLTRVTSAPRAPPTTSACARSPPPAPSATASWKFRIATKTPRR